VSGVVTFDGAPPEGTINLGIGQPSADLLPVDLLRQASESYFSSAHPFDLNYGVLAGDERFRESLAGYLSDSYHAPAAPESLFVTGGSSQGLDLVSTVFSRPGDTVFVEEPTYFLAYQILRDHGLKLVGVPVDKGGLRVDILESLLAEHRPAFVYTIPSYQNPSGQCQSAERRARLLDLSRKHGFLIVADEVYQLLYYRGEPPPAFGTMIQSDTVLSLGSFSKILAPSLRLGWVQAGPGCLDRLLANGLVNSGGSLNHQASHLVRHALDLGLQAEHVRGLRRSLGKRVDVMQAALEEHFGELATWNRPSGGYFFWLRLDESVDTRDLLDKAKEGETGFQPGSLFSSQGGLANYLRLSFAHYGEAEIREGIARLRRVFA
jgi:DNA-binding transcriptional MocR family regulator